MRAHILLAVVLAAGAIPARAAAQPGSSGWTAVDSVVAVVNQDVVLKSELDRRAGTFRQSLEAIKDVAERSRRRVELQQQLVRSLVDERVFLQAAAGLGLTATSQEVDRAIAEVKAQNRVDDAALAAEIAKNGYTMAEYRQDIQRQILAAKVAGLVIRPRIRIGETELRAAYKEAQKRDPKRIGTFEEVRRPLEQRLFEEAMEREQGRWLAERRAEAYIDVRIKL